MGSDQSQTRRKKGVVYSKETNEIVDCLFCRIAQEKMPENQLWYKDELCAVFIPRTPAARLHLLIIPIEHVRNVRTLTEKHRFLLEHMKKVALEQLRIHSQHFGLNGSRLLPRAVPPSQYGFNRGNLPALCPTVEIYRDEPTTNDSSFDLCFHRPPYNSIDHLHLHAIQKPFRTTWNHIMFAKRLPWHGSLENILDKLPQETSKL